MAGCFEVNVIVMAQSRYSMTLFDKVSSYFTSSAVTVGVCAFAAGFIVHKISNRRAAVSSSVSTTVRSTTASGSVVYESSRAVDEYLLFHYLPGEELCPYDLAPRAACDFPKRCADLCAKYAPKGKPGALLRMELDRHVLTICFR